MHRAVLLVFALLLLRPGDALPSALILNFMPAVQDVSSGPISVQIEATGFPAAGVAALGDFGFSVNFNPNIVTAASVNFGNLLGDPANLEALTTSDLSTPGTATLNEVSLLPPDALISLQEPSLASGFVLATLEFDPAGVGTTGLAFSGAIAGDQNGATIPLSTGSGSITVVPEPAMFPMTGIALGLLCIAGHRKGRRWLLSLVLCAAGLRAAEPKFGPAIPVEDAKGVATGIEYMVGTTSLQPSAKGVASMNLVTPIKITNTNKQDQKLAMCLTGYSVTLDGTFPHMLITMVINVAGNITCSLPNAQNLAAKTERLGAMGCRLFAVPAGKSVDGTFVSGNDRTIPMFDGKGKPVAGQFKMVGDFGGVGPTQTGTVGSGVASGNGWGLVGGHPGVTKSDVKATGMTAILTKALDTLAIHIILLNDPKLGFEVDPTPPPARDKAVLNCNKCFGMGPTGGGTGLGDYYGYQIEPLSAADRKGLKSIFVNHWVKYNSLKLTKSETLAAASLNLYSDDTYFADNATEAYYTLDSTLPSSCSISNLSVPASTGSNKMTFSVSPMEQKTLTFDIVCDSTLVTGSAGDVTLNLYDASDDTLLGQEFARAVAPVPCDVNADGSVDSLDISEILANVGAAGGPYDIDGDGLVTPNDARVCTLQCSLTNCAVPALP